MSSDINKVIIIGRMTRDSELKHTPSGTAVASFSLANNYSFTSGGEKKENVNYFNCVAWSKLGEIITEYCKKGQQIAVEGRLQQRRWDDQDGNKKSTIEIVVENFQFVGGKKETDAKSPDNSIGTPVDLPAEENPFSDDSIPF